MASAPSIVLSLRDGNSCRVLRNYYGLTSDEVGHTIGRSGRWVRRWEERGAIEPAVAETLRAGIEAAVLAQVLVREGRDS